MRIRDWRAVKNQLAARLKGISLSLETGVSAIQPKPLRLSMLLAGSAVLTSALGLCLIYFAAQRENGTILHANLEATGALLATHTQGELNQWQRRILELTEMSVKPLLLAHDADRQAAAEIAARAASEAAGVVASPIRTETQAPGAGSLDADPEILDISIWRRPEGSVFGTATKSSRRAFVAMNSHYDLAAHQADPDAVRAEIVRQLQQSESRESFLIEQAFAGKTALGALEGSLPGIATMALPGPAIDGAITEVYVGHLRLERLQKAFIKSGPTLSVLVDSGGTVLAHPDSRWVRTRTSLADSPLFKASKPAPGLDGVMRFEDRAGDIYVGAFRKVGHGGLVVLSSIAASKAREGMNMLRIQGLVLLVLAFGLWTSVFYRLITQGWLLARLRSAVPDAASGDEQVVSVAHVPAMVVAPERKQVTALHGSIRALNELLERHDPVELAEAINDFLTLAASRVKHYGGLFERWGDGSFVASWGAPVSEGTEVWKAIRCALELRGDLRVFNETRKTDGQKPFVFGMGVHTGMALAARLGPSHLLHYSVIGNVLHCARALDRIAPSVGTDLLISQETWTQSEARFLGEQSGEAKLTADTGLMPYYRITGYRDEQGQEMVVQVSLPEGAESLAGVDQGITAAPDTPIISATTAAESPARWLINNGSQIIGPFGPKEVASRLYAQELDFDCECWTEGTGHSAQIANAGIFSGSEDQGASLWIYDGETIHGPVSPGFLRTALIHGAVPMTAWICEGSTVNGWRTVSAWDPAFTPQAPVNTGLMKRSAPHAASDAPEAAPESDAQEEAA